MEDSKQCYTKVVFMTSLIIKIFVPNQKFVHFSARTFFCIDAGYSVIFGTNLKWSLCYFSIKYNFDAGTAPSSGAIWDEFSEQF